MWTARECRGGDSAKRRNRATIGVALWALLLSPELSAENKDITEVGDVLQFLVPTLAIGSTFIAGAPDGSLWDREGTWQSTKAVGATGLTVWTGKLISQKMRPSGRSRTSFPSGHTSGACSGGAFIAIRYDWYWGVPAMAACAFTAYSRVQAEAHFVDDVTAGGSIALLYNFLFTTPRQGVQNLFLMPMPLEDGAGINVLLSERDDTKSKLRYDEEKPLRFRFNFAFGPAFIETNSISSPSNGGTKFDLANFRKRDDPTSTAAASFEYFINTNNSVALGVIPFESRDDGQFASPVSFAGATFPPNTQVNSEWRLNDFRGEWAYHFSREEKLNYHAGIGLQVQDLDVELETADGSVSAKVDDTVALPYLLGGIEYEFTPRWKTYAWANGIATGEDWLLETSAGIAFQPTRHWEWAGGYYFYGREIDTSELKNLTKYQGPYLAVSYSW